jgi:CheY-like chemotaxis protein
MEERQLPLQILSVDDDPVNRRVLQRHLEELGHQVDSAVDGQQAVEKFKQKNYYDIIFMDLLMPEMDGIQACLQIRRIEDQIDMDPVYICAITASVIGEIEENCRQAGMNNYLSKPFTPDDLERIIKDYLDD